MLSMRVWEWSPRFAGLLGLAAVLLSSQGCAQQGYSVIASTATVIGVEVSQNPATQAPQAKLGYNRGELAFVPTNRHAGDHAGTTKEGARDTADVIMELRYGGIFDLGPSSGIYQRLAVGDIAVKQDGTALLFAKNADGQIDPAVARALGAVKGIPAVSPDVEAAMSLLAEKFLELERKNDTEGMRKFAEAADMLGYESIGEFLTDRGATLKKVTRMRDELEKRGVRF